VTLSFDFKLYLPLKPKFWFQTKLKLRSLVLNQTIIMYFDRQLSLNT